jgi:serine/threonine protein kinase
MKIDREQWNRLSALLDAALDVAASERENWVQQLSGDAAALREPLRTLLARRAHIETDDFLKTPDFAAALRVEAFRSQQPPLVLQAGNEVGAYRLLRELGQGGMGSVWLAERIDGKLKRQVALKFPYAGPNQRQLAERLTRERDILAGLEHSNIARLYDADVTSLGQPFLVLEYVDGVPINDYCDQHRLAIRERLRLTLQVLDAVQYAHTHLVVHRDLKPSNILITHDGVARLLDFGIAKLVSAGEAKETALTQFGGRALTPDYASPEQISGQPITTASDIYSLGVVLYELLTGNRPYRLKRDSRACLEDAIAEADVIAPSRATMGTDIASMRSTTARSLIRQLRGDLDTIVLKALGKEATERYASVDAFARDLRRSLDNQPVDARPHSRLYLFKKLLVRNKLAFGAIAVVVLSLMLGVGAATWQAARAHASERRAIAEAATSEAVKQFMIRIFQTNTLGQADPAKARQKNALELLEAGANRVGVEFKDNPALHREMLAVILRLLGESRSKEYDKHALELLELLKGVPGSELQQAGIYFELSLSEESKVAEGHVKAGLAVLGTASNAAARKQKGMLLWQYAHIRQDLGDYDGARGPLLEARELLAQDSSRTAEYGHVLGDLGWDELAQNHIAGGVKYFEQAMQAYESDPTVYQRTIALGRNDLGSGYSYNKQYAAAEREWRLAAEGFEKDYGVADPQTAFSNARLASVIALQNRYDEALALLHPAIKTLEKPMVFASNAGYLVIATGYLADTLLQAGRLRDAEPAAQRILAFAATDATVIHIAPLFAVAEYDSVSGKYADAEAVARRAVELGVEGYGANSAKVPRLNNKLGRILIDIGKLDEADALFGASMKGDATNAAIFNSTWTVASVQHARALLARGQAKQAAAQLHGELEKYLAQPLDHRDINDETELQLSLGRALMTSGSAAGGLPHLERALELRQTQYALSFRLAEAEVALADCKLRLGDLAGSRTLLTKAKAIHAASPPLGKRYRQPLLELSQRLLAAESHHAAK